VPVSSVWTLGKKGRAFFEAEQNWHATIFDARAIRFPPEPRFLIRELAWKMPRHPSGQNWRGRRKSAHTKDDLRFELLVNRSTPGKTFSEPSNESENFRRINGRKTNRRPVFSKPELRPGRKARDCRSPFGNEQEYVVSALRAETSADGDSGKKDAHPVPSTCNDRVSF